MVLQVTRCFVASGLAFTVRDLGCRHTLSQAEDAVTSCYQDHTGTHISNYREQAPGHSYLGGKPRLEPGAQAFDLVKPELGPSEAGGKAWLGSA
jgi:hypothetical protein